MLEGTTNNPEATSPALQASVNMLTVKVHNIVFRRGLNRTSVACLGGLLAGSFFSLKRTWFGLVSKVVSESEGWLQWTTEEG